MKQFSSYDEINPKPFSDVSAEGEQCQEAEQILSISTGEPAIPKEHQVLTKTVPIPMYPTSEYEITEVSAAKAFEKEAVPQSALVPRVSETETVINPAVCINYAKVRVLNAAANYVPIHVSIGSRSVAEELSFGKVSDYQRIIDGYRSVLISSSVTGAVLAHNVLPFISGSKITLAVLNTAAGIEIISVSDEVCRSKMKGRSCFRVANLTYDAGPFDLALCNGYAAFSDVRTKEVTPWKQAVQGEYDFYVLNTLYEDAAKDGEGLLGYEVAAEIPSFPVRDIGTESILDFFIKISGDTMYTAYLIGGYSSSVPLRTVLVEN